VKRDAQKNPLAFIKNRFLRDTVTLQVSSVLNQASQVVSTLAIAFLLTSHGQGQFVLAVMMQGLFYTLVHMGIVPATVSMVAASSARGMREKVATWMALLVKSYVVVSLILVGAGYFVLPAVTVMALNALGNKIPVDDAREIGLWAWWLTFWIPIDIPRACAQVAFHATRRMHALAQLDNGQELMRMFLVLSGALITGSPAGAVLGEIGSRVLASGLAAQMYHRARHDGGPWLPTAGEILQRVPGVPLLAGMRLGLRVGVIKAAAAVVVTIAPRVLIGGIAGASWAAYFNIAQKLMGIPQMMMQGVSRNILPALSEQRSRHDLAGFKRLYLRATVFTGLVISGLTLLGLLLIPWVLPAVLPDDYAEPVLLCCLILTVGVVPLSFAVAQDPFYILTDRMKANVIICFIGALVTIPANAILIYFQPTTGPVWGLTVYMGWVLVHFVYIERYFRRVAPSSPFWKPEAAGSAPLPVL
jgi:O-antigen/teichoic acid export membrane protein